jgi:uncharacterized membrane protein YgdD (TMEM256/DUF423 family)
MKKLSLILIALGISAGAFGAHGLKNLVSAERLEVFKTASQYQITISILLLFLASNSDLPKLPLKILAAGIIIFSFSLYLLVILDLPILGAITPIGGITMIGAILYSAYLIK